MNDQLIIYSQSYYSELGCLKMLEHVFNKRHFNVVVSFYDNSPVIANPHCIMRFDARLINDIAII